MYFLACFLLLLFFAVAAVFFTYSLFVFLIFQLSLEELLGDIDNSFVHPSMHCVIVIIDKAKCSFLVVSPVWQDCDNVKVYFRNYGRSIS